MSFSCNKCKQEFDDENSLQRHSWKYHPKNKTEKTWSKHAREGFKNWKGSSYYASYGPYY